MAAARRHILLAAALAAILSLGRHLPFATDSFDQGFEAMNGGRFQGAIQMSWLEGGFWRMAGRPILSPLPTTPPSGTTYGNHPPLFHWVTAGVVSIAGLSEASLRAFPMLCCALTGFLLALLAARSLGAAGAYVVAVVWAAMPMGFFYGRMANYESPVLLVMVAVIHLMDRDAPGFARRAAGALLIYMGVLIDWATGFVIPSLLLIDLLRGRRRRIIGRTWPLAAAVVAAVVSYLTVLAGWEHGFGAAIDRIRSAAGLAADDSRFGATEFFAAQVGHVFELFGWPAAAIGVGATIWSVLPRARARAPRDDAAALMLGFLLIPLQNVALFPARAFNHDFWWYYWLPAPVLGTAVFVVSLWRVRPDRASSRLARVTSIAVVLGVLATGVSNTMTRYLRENTGATELIATRINASCDDETLLMTPLEPGSWYFYLNAWPFDAISGTDVVERTLAAFRRGELRARTFVLLCDESVAAAVPELIDAEVARGMRVVRHGATVSFVWTR